jgi:hypothetical protein
VTRQLTEAPPPIQQLRADIPAPVAEIVHRLLAKDPNARHQSAAEVAARLEALAATVPDPAGIVNYDLPALQSGRFSFAPGLHIDLQTAAATDTSPWAQLTDDSAQCATLSQDQQLTPLDTRSSRQNAAWKRSRGVPKGTMLAICVGVIVVCVVIGVAAVKAMAK